MINFTNKISKRLSKPDKKFTADITYGMLASGSCLLTDVVDQLHESSKKINVVDRLSRHLEKGIPASAATSYLQQIKKWVPCEPVIHIDDSDVVKPDGYKFEALGIVRDGSESSYNKNVYKKGYHVTEACVLTTSNHPVSFFSKIHSSSEKDYKSVNTITFLKLDELGQDYVIRVARTYFSCWKIEEYFRCKKQMFQSENFRVRKLKAINALNFYITLCMAFLAMVSMESEKKHSRFQS